MGAKELQSTVESENDNNQKEAAQGMKRTTMVVVRFARIHLNYAAVKADWFAEYIGTKIGKI